MDDLVSTPSDSRTLMKRNARRDPGTLGVAGHLAVTPLADRHQRLSDVEVAEFRRRLSSGAYETPDVLYTVAVRLLAARFGD